jgi:hypothetical protein
MKVHELDHDIDVVSLEMLVTCQFIFIRNWTLPATNLDQLYEKSRT